MTPKSPHRSTNSSPNSDKKRAVQTAIRTTQKVDLTAQLTKDYTTQIATCQESDKTELVEVFTPKRFFTELLSNSFSRLNLDSRAFRTAVCGTVLAFSHEVTEDGISEHGKLVQANFCRDRLCPLCSYRRSLKIFAQVSKIMTAMPKDTDYLFLTLTVPNCAPFDLDNTLTKLFKGFDRLMKRRNIKKVVQGFFRALEVTRNDNHDTYHPHFHVILAVNKSYFKSRDYIKQVDWLQMWRDCYGDQSITQVDIRRAKPKKSDVDTLGQMVSDLGSVVAEVAKYTLKSSEYIFSEDPEKTDRVISVLAGALKNRRLVQYGGIFKKLHKQLNLDDPEDGNLIHVDEDLHPALANIIITYGWSVGVYKTISRELISTEAKLIDPDAPDGSVIHLNLDLPLQITKEPLDARCRSTSDELADFFKSALIDDDI